MSIGTTKLSSKGQVVIPEDVRIALGLREGHQFLVIPTNDAVILKSILPPSNEEIKSILSSAKDVAKKAKLTRTDLEQSIKKVRRQK